METQPRKLTDEEVTSLSPGIRDLVLALRDAGFNTTDSGDGSNYVNGMDCALPFSMVAMTVTKGSMVSEADRLAEWFEKNNPGWEAWQITASYTPGGTPLLILNEVSDETLEEMKNLVGHRPSGLIP